MRKLLLVPFVLLLLSASLAVKEDNEELKIDLFYTKNYPGDKWENHRTGLLWTLSYLGAILPKDSFDRAISWIDSSTFSIRFSGLGFNKQAQGSLRKMFSEIQRSKEYKKSNSLDLGAFVSLTIGWSYNYYEITGVPKTLQQFYSLHHFNRYAVFPVINSGVAKHHRLLKYKTNSEFPGDWAFIAEEKAALDSKAPSAFEAFDIMPNGQLRFAVYDSAGALVSGSPSSLGAAGKPAKCMWCHEINILPLFTKNDPVDGFISSSKFNNNISELMEKLGAYRKTLNSDIDFYKTQDHTQMELMYISYMQPSGARLAQEWKLSPTETSKLVEKLTKTTYHEFPFLGQLVSRHDIKRKDLDLPLSIRETTTSEPRFIK
jgi:hypothetical protein